MPEPLHPTLPLDPAHRPIPIGDTLADGATTPNAHDPNRTVAFTGTGAAPTALPALPGFQLEKELGRGGMGVVYRAKQLGLDRTVALKMILRADFASAEQKLRFQIEAENAARVQHPNIVQVHEIGEHQGQPYFALEFVEGGSLADWLNGHRASPAEAARLVETLARAMHAAHAQGVVHRDLKPANVLLGEPSASADGFMPKIADFGLAKRLDGANDLTGSGAIMGTPSHMAPEQARGDTKHVGPAADQFALGVIFYQLLTNRLPFEANSVPALLKKIVEEEPAAPKSRNPQVPADLSVICLKCLEKEPAKRYATCEALAEDLKSWREHRPITARPATRAERVAKWCRRYPAVAALIVVSILAALTASGLAWWAVGAERQAVANENQALRERDLKEEQRRRADEEKNIAQAVREFLQRKLLAQRNAWVQADHMRGTGESGEQAELDPPISVLLRRAADELAPDRIEASFPNQPLVQAELLQTVGNTYRSMGGMDNDRYKLAIRCLERSADLRRRHVGTNHADTLRTLSDLAGAHHEAGNFADATRLFEQIRDVQASMPNVDPLDVLDLLSNLAGTHFAAGKRPEAIRLFENVREAQAKLLGIDHPNTLVTLNNLAGAYRDAGRLPEAIRLYEQARDVQAAKLGLEHPHYLTTISSLAVAYRQAGRLPEAIDLYEHALSTKTRILGAHHPNTLITISNLAAAFEDAGNLPNAIRLFEQVRDAQIAKLGPEHPDTLTTLGALADALRKAGKLTDAIRLLVQVRDAQIAKLGADHPSVLSTLDHLAEAHRTARNLPEAIRLFELVLTTRKAAFGADDLRTFHAQHNLAVAYLDSGRLAEAICLLEEVRAARARSLQADHPAYLSTLDSLAAAYWTNKQLDKSVPLFEEALRRQEARLGRQHPSTQHTLANLGVNYKDSGRLAEALPPLQEAYAFSRDYPPLRWVGEQLLDAYARGRQPEEASKLVDALLDEYRKDFPKDSLPVAQVLATFGFDLLRAGAFKAAEPRLRECLAIREKAEPDEWTTFNAQSMLGAALMGQKQHATAEPLLLQGYHGLKARADKIPAASKDCLPEALDRLIALYEATGRPAEAARVRAKAFAWRLPPRPPAR